MHYDKAICFFLPKVILGILYCKIQWMVDKKIGHWGIHTAIKINRMNEEKTNVTQGDTNGNTWKKLRLWSETYACYMMSLQ